VALFVALLVYPLENSGPKMWACPSSKSRVAQIVTREFVFEALPQWQAEHHTTCPPDLAALTPYMNSDDVNDPWGHPYAFVCDPRTGAAAVVSSFDSDDDALPTSAAVAR
jgi:hypothetical protein